MSFSAASQGYTVAGPHLLRPQPPRKVQTKMTALPIINLQTLKCCPNKGGPVLIDIRDPAEHARERVAGLGTVSGGSSGNRIFHRRPAARPHRLLLSGSG